jgi:hypothetical protein
MDAVQHQSRPGLRFNPEINAGHLLTMLTMTGTIVAMWFSFDKRLALTEQVVSQMKDQIVITSETQRNVVRTVDKLVVIVDEMQKRKP